MKKRNFVLCLLAALVVPALVILFRPTAAISIVAASAKPAAPVVAQAAPLATSPDAASQAPTAQAPTAQAKIVQQFVATFGSWENATGLDGDRLEEQLRGMITDENAEVLLRALPPRFQGTYVANLLVARWASRDRDGALQWLAGQENPTLFEVNAATKNWVEEDREGLEKYLAALSASPWKSLVLESTGRDALTHQDPEQAFYLLQAMDENPAKTPLLANAVQQWAQWDPRAAVDEINKLPDPATREQLVLAVASGYALANPDAAADWVRQSFPAGPSLDRGLSGVMQAWASNGDPVKAAQWVTNLPDSSTRANALQALVTAWNQDSPETLMNWLSALPDGPIRTQANAALTALASSH